ncbi:tRNA1(Val) (adenine(37)-N6)-methyltransferase [Fructilactobacillus sanfranciscensis]|uniref:tRNA1(Val) (adenine(37)-N6)-methyltransferase n=1 Tax=Fructilactobacillus sanfranciscensis TaxID=1625 RepID=UPI0015D5B6B8|nr:tRNA1(Val) (adenine(37)-N6)-methyltransferase [Fructilactobacillus sanfranciscensis]
MDQTIELKQGERIDQLYSSDIKIIQNAEVFSFSLDAVMLADFAQVKQSYKTKIVDLCAGNGAVGLFISKKTHGKIAEVEIQPKLSDMAKRSVTLNNLEKHISVYNIDLKNSLDYFKKESIDHVTVNPPYFANEKESSKNPNPYLAIARHEIKTNLEIVIKTSSDLLKNNGKMYMVHRPDRLLDILNEMQKYRLAPKEIQFVYPKVGRDANMILISGIKDGKLNGLKVKPPIVVYDENDNYTEPVRKMLYGK